MTFGLIDTVTPLEHRIRAYLNNEKKNRDRNIRKIAETLMEDKMISPEICRIHIKHLRKTKSRDNFETLLLALLLTAYEEYDESIALFQTCIETAEDSPIADEIRQYIILIRVSELNDFTNIENDAETLLRSIGSDENIVTLLWRLQGHIDASENLELFLKLVLLAIDLYPEQFRLRNYKAWIFREQKKIDQAVTEYLKIVEYLNLEQDNEFSGFELASGFMNLAECQLLIPEPDAGAAIAYCNQALNYQVEGEEFMIGNMILLTRAKAYLLQERNDDNIIRIREDIIKVLETDPDNEEAKSILQKIES